MLYVFVSEPIFLAKETGLDLAVLPDVTHLPASKAVIASVAALAVSGGMAETEALKTPLYFHPPSEPAVDPADSQMLECQHLSGMCVCHFGDRHPLLTQVWFREPHPQTSRLSGKLGDSFF